DMDHLVGSESRKIRNRWVQAPALFFLPSITRIDTMSQSAEDTLSIFISSDPDTEPLSSNSRIQTLCHSQPKIHLVSSYSVILALNCSNQDMRFEPLYSRIQTPFHSLPKIHLEARRKRQNYYNVAENSGNNFLLSLNLSIASSHCFTNEVAPN
nr:hypothetical protein [Tanacetum cinerariifolium]